ncbi:endonuclease/exonuclease/phosphatase family protein [Duganella qianjiadongensis]|uniref:Endonuclease/exonuclease/phosphatase family protein n=1 Tax=Duganella qianjiadongensis TaxID=2692176 RepID=A0ABW9VJN0_9BURK|nr:endonuclease/exonuclease/phosphatase family protein [Duganella qianjiadongensis]MYM38754.1 endonuclease/exonuclease/phosphatase family protein [Duganella qianjiadongensis]
MPQEIRFATFNVCNLSLPGEQLYDNLPPLTPDAYAAKVQWTAQQLDRLDADVIGLQEVFSLQTLRDVMAASVGYRNAVLAGVSTAPDPVTGQPRQMPQVALISRLPLAAPAAIHTDFPAGVTLPAGSRDALRYARALLRVTLQLEHQRQLDVIVLHLKSKRPDYDGEVAHDNPMCHAQAQLRSLIRRGTEAVALRSLLCQLNREAPRPRIVLGDFNDSVDAVTTSIIMGEGGSETAGRYYDSRRIQQDPTSSAHGYTILHEEHRMTIDHVLVSEHFHPASPQALGRVRSVRYFSEHLPEASPCASDHGQVLVQVQLD